LELIKLLGPVYFQDLIMRAIHHGQFPSNETESAETQEDLQSLVEQMSGIARQISRLGTGEAQEANSTKRWNDADLLRRMLNARRARTKFFNPGLFADPAWDMLLDLYLAHLTHRRVSVTGLCSASQVPATTALRWIKTLEDDGLVSRHPDKFDGRRSFIELTAKAEQSLQRFFASLEDLLT
jgi:DNA-binding MarR family transcriptional regulator